VQVATTVDRVVAVAAAVIAAVESEAAVIAAADYHIVTSIIVRTSSMTYT
jgi:hypothetical protein